MTMRVHVLSCVFGLGSWVAINGLWLQLPLLVQRLPEGWELPAHLSVLIQLANLGPLLVGVGYCVQRGRVQEKPVVSVVLVVGVLACVLLALLWRHTSWLLGRERSTAFLVLAFFLSLVDCTSSITFLPFMMQLPARYITSFFVGEGLSGFVPGLVALAQGVGMTRCVNASQSDLPANGTTNATNLPGFSIQTQHQPPNFSPDVFFGFLAAMTATSLAAFLALTRVPRTLQLSTESLVSAGTGEEVASVCAGIKTTSGTSDAHRQRSPILAKPGHSWCQQAFIYAMVLWANSATNGLLPSVQTYSCMPYGSLAYHLALTLAALANPIACLIAMARPQRSLVCLGVLTILGSVFGGYNMAMAAMSPCPLLHGSPLGEAFIVLSWVLFSGLLSYVKVMVGVILRDWSHSALVWCGAAAQVGSLLGSVTMFPLVSIYHLFQAGDMCNTTCPS